MVRSEILMAGCARLAIGVGLCIVGYNKMQPTYVEQALPDRHPNRFSSHSSNRCRAPTDRQLLQPSICLRVLDGSDAEHLPCVALRDDSRFHLFRPMLMPTPRQVPAAPDRAP